MPSTVQQLADEPIIVQTYPSEFAVADMISAIDTIVGLLDASPVPLTLISDASQTRISFDAFLVGVNTAIRQIKLLSHPNLTRAIVITSNPVLTLSTKGLNSPVFGNANVVAVKTMEEALQLARSKEG